MKPLTLLYVDTEHFWRGGQEQLFSLMKGMKERNHTVCLAAPYKAPLSQRAREIGIVTYGFHQRNELSLRALLRLRQILRGRHFDVIHFNTPRPIVAGGLMAALAGVKVRISSRRVNFPLKSRFSRLKYNWLQDAIVTVSDTIRETLLAGGVSPSLVRVIYEGVDLHWIDRQQPPKERLGNGNLVVGTVAHLSQEKGHETLLKAAASLKSRFHNVTYLLVGDGELRSRLHQLTSQLRIETQVNFTGFRSDCEGLMKQFDVFCLPSRSEGLSSAILAAMANSLPVVATNVGGIPELVVDGETGILVEPDNPSELAAALSRLLASRELRRRLGQQGRRRIERHFTLQRKLDQTERLYRSLLASNHSE
ncbi:MAG TPA: glycosyltransferase family 4 protein [Acidobacteriota bacterium]|nr:glycosyltransferase family 4 protein [Acidobacteriota bacterium]